MKISIQQPTYIKSLNAGIAYITDLTTISSDLRPFFKDIKPDITQSIQSEFDSSNPNKWQPISKAWEAQKIAEGKPENIGIYTGELMKAASTDAIIKEYPTALTWEIAPVDSIGFTAQRHIGITTREWLRSLGRRIVKVILARG